MTTTTSTPSTSPATVPSPPILQVGKHRPVLRCFTDLESAARAATRSPWDRFVDARAFPLSVGHAWGRAPVLRVSRRWSAKGKLRARALAALKHAARAADPATLAAARFASRQELDAYIRELRELPPDELIAKLCAALDPREGPRPQFPSRRLCKLFRTC